MLRDTERLMSCINYCTLSPTQSRPNLPAETKHFASSGGPVQLALNLTELTMPPDTDGSQPLPSRSSASLQLSRGVTRVEVTLKLTTPILALAAGVYTYP